jgi:hypothetical protein
MKRLGLMAPFQAGFQNFANNMSLKVLPDFFPEM